MNNPGRAPTGSRVIIIHNHISSIAVNRTEPSAAPAKTITPGAMRETHGGNVSWLRVPQQIVQINKRNLGKMGDVIKCYDAR